MDEGVGEGCRPRPPGAYDAVMPAREVHLRPATLEDAEPAVVGLVVVAMAVHFYERHGFVADGAVVDGRAFGGIAAVRMAR